MKGQTAKNSKPKASERLDSLEKQLLPTAKRLGELEMIVFNLSRENEILKEAVQMLHEKNEAVIDLIRSGKELSDDNINDEIVKLKELSLKEKVDTMLEKKQIVKAEEVGEESLIVARELSKEGKVENPRIQFLVGRLVDELKNKFIGKKAGELIEGEENKLDVEIMEIYNFNIEELQQEELQQEEAAVEALAEKTQD